jgi:hypothetical protein
VAEAVNVFNNLHQLPVTGICPVNTSKEQIQNSARKTALIFILAGLNLAALEQFLILRFLALLMLLS